MTGLKYKKVTLMSRMQITNGTCRCFAQIETLNDNPYLLTNRGV